MGTLRQKILRRKKNRFWRPGLESRPIPLNVHHRASLAIQETPESGTRCAWRRGRLDASLASVDESLGFAHCIPFSTGKHGEICTQESNSKEWRKQNANKTNQKEDEKSARNNEFQTKCNLLKEIISSSNTLVQTYQTKEEKKIEIRTFVACNLSVPDIPLTLETFSRSLTSLFVLFSLCTFSKQTWHPKSFRTAKKCLH